MPSWILPSDSHAPGDTGHTTDHNHIVDDLSIIAEFLPVTGAAPVLGQITYQGVGPAPAQLSGNTTTAKNFLTQTGTGAVSAAPSWGLIAAADLPTGTTSTQGALQLDGTASDIQPIGVRAAGSAGLAADSGHIHATPMTTAGDLLVMNATPAPARLATGAANQFLGISSGAPAWLTNFVLQANTAAAGYSLVNGTGTVISYTTPNDGNLHTINFIGVMHNTTAMTGGQISVTFTDPSGTSNTFTLLAGAFAANQTNTDDFNVIANPNTVVSITQSTAMTAGSSKLWAQIWGT